MNTILKSIILLLFVSLNSVAQNLEKQEREANNQLREANALYQKGNYADAEVSYKKSVATNPGNPKSVYNLANSIMQQKRYKEAISQYDYLAKNAKSKQLKSQSFHNIGNANMGLNDYQKAVDAYKNSLRINPRDEETRYNLALAQELLKQQQDQNQDNKDDQDKNDKNKDQDKDNKEDEKKDDEGDDEKDKKNDPNEDEKDQDKNKESDEDKKEQPKDNKEYPKQQQPQPGKLSPDQVKQLLEAMQNEEKKTQDKINAKKIKGQPIKKEKDW